MNQTKALLSESWDAGTLSRRERPQSSMRRSLLPLLSCTVLLSLGAGGRAEVVMDGDLRVLRVRAAADEEFRERPDWEDVVGDHLSFASSFYEKSFDIRFELVEAVEWESDDGATLSELVDRLEEEISFDDVDVALGFTAQRPNRGKLSKYVPLPWGLTPSLGRVSVVRAMLDDASYDLHLALIHEVAHLFGAFHVSDPNFVMRETVHGPRTFQFDVENGKLLRLMKDYDFGKGVAALATEMRERITELWKHGGLAHDNNPVAEALFNIGIDLQDAGQTEQAIAAWREAGGYDRAFAAPHGLVGVALADMGQYAAALKELQVADRLGWPEARQVMQLIRHEQATGATTD
jgi:tetratricopeptide (TPR) repeat protein